MANLLGHTQRLNHSAIDELDHFTLAAVTVFAHLGAFGLSVSQGHGCFSSLPFDLQILKTGRETVFLCLARPKVAGRVNHRIEALTTRHHQKHGVPDNVRGEGLTNHVKKNAP